ncbi:Uncharacterised protein [Streptomyces griseus]|nr:Uncharacterised protein [Streptomyces griseus]
MAVEHADLAVGERLEGLRPVQLARLDRSGEALADEVVPQPAERGDVLGRVDVVGADVVRVAAATAEEPHQGLGLGLLLAQRQGEGVVDALGLERGGVAPDVVPGLGGAQARPVEQLLVVEEEAGAGDEGQSVQGAVDLAGFGEPRQEVRRGADRERLVGGVELARLGVVRVGADLGDVRGVAGLDHRGDLAVDVLPVEDGDVDLDAGVLLLEARREPAPVLLGAVLRAGAVVGGDQFERDVARAGVTAAARQRRRHSQRGHRRGQTQKAPLHSLAHPRRSPGSRTARSAPAAGPPFGRGSAALSWAPSG